MARSCFLFIEVAAARTRAEMQKAGRTASFRDHAGICIWVLLGAILNLVATVPVHAAVPPDSAPPYPAPQITQAIDSRYSPMQTGVRPEATSANDLGPVADDFPLDHMVLLLHRPAESERALDAFMAEQTDPKSPNYHHWLTARQVGQYGPAQSDIDTIVGWLQSQGFAVKTHADGMKIVFSGNAGQVKRAFKTEIHHLNVGGVAHIANMSKPQIPTALAPAVVGIVSLNDFLPHSMSGTRPSTINSGTGTPGNGSTQLDAPCPFGDTHCSGVYIGPQDLATIYNLAPLFNAVPKINGAGQKIAIFFNAPSPAQSDYAAFRTRAGLPAAPFTFFSPDCTAPTTAPPGFLAGLMANAEFAGAAAPGAEIEIVSCADTATDGGPNIAMDNLNSVDDPTMVWSFGFGDCEPGEGSVGNAAYATTYQTAAARGVSVFAVTTDSGAAACDAGHTAATNGITVSAAASTPYNVAVGGTDFGSSTFSSSGFATSYINEMSYNDYALVHGYGVSAGGGGPSGCGTGDPSPSTPFVVSGTCAGYPKPTWQAGLIGNPADGVRDIPDVALFAGDGTRKYAYGVECTFNTATNDCSTTGGNPTVLLIGGTDLATSVMAGVQALVNQSTGSAQGNPNPTYYSLAAAAYGPTGNPSCNSTLGSSVSSSCVFYDITQGDIVVPCSGPYDCYGGKLSTSDTSYEPAYPATTGWDFATGIGSVNGYNLAVAWPAAYWIGGSVSGLTESGLVLALTWGSQTTSIGSGATSYQFATLAPSNAPYTVSVQTQPTGQTCALANPTGTVATMNVSNVDVTCTTNTYSVTYTTDGNGTISGNPSQTVSYDGSGSAVTAVANAGYHFVQWSDGSTANPRTDSNVTAAISVTADFAPNVLVFTTQPADVIQGDSLGSIAVTEEDGSGHTIADNATVEFTIVACGGNEALGSATMVNGVATLNGDQRFYTAPVTGLTITASVTNPSPSPIQSLASGTFNVASNSDLLFNSGFESCRL